MGIFHEQYSRNITWEYSPEFHRGLFLNIPGIYLGIFHEYFMSNIPGTLLRNTPRNFIGNFFSIFWEYVMGMFHEYSTNIYLPNGNRPNKLEKINFKNIVAMKISLSVIVPIILHLTLT